MAGQSPETYVTEFFKSDTEQGVLLKDRLSDNIVTAIINLGAEVWTIRRRNLVVERLLAEHSGITTQMIEKYVPTEAMSKEWEKDRDQFVMRIYEVLARTGEVAVTAKLDAAPPRVNSVRP